MATVFATAAITYRYTLWITRPPTWRYFKAGWRNFLSWQNFRHYTFLIPRLVNRYFWSNLYPQTRFHPLARPHVRLARQTSREVTGEVTGGILITLSLSRQNLAEMTGTTLYTVSRILKYWDDQGLIEAGRERVMVRDLSGLLVVAEGQATISCIERGV